MIDWIGKDNQPCAMVDACNLQNVISADDVFNFMKENFDRHYTGWREPFGVFLHAAWFQANETRFAGYEQFLDYLGGLNDVYIVSGSQALKWTRNPTNIGGAGSVFDCPPRAAPCMPKTCVLEHPNGGTRYMEQCVDCPANYPCSTC
ncbi:hypothetical protein B566_EDAN014803 [Ephemera danica]|nr:hypothetical protein B566_EDAN014803 [Ephemera danica]